MTYRLIHANVIEGLRDLPAESVHCIVTSPPYYRLRNYGFVGQIGLENTLEEYIGKLVDVFRECRRVLRSDGTLWVNIGDTYSNDGGEGSTRSLIRAGRSHQQVNPVTGPVWNIKPKNLCLVPQRLAIALQTDGWWIRKDNIWAKNAPMPESVKDRPHTAHEYVWLCAKSEHYFYDWFGVRQPTTGNSNGVGKNGRTLPLNLFRNGGKPQTFLSKSPAVSFPQRFRNLRSVWQIKADPYKGHHYATFASGLPRTCIQAGTSEYGCCSACGKPYRRIVETPRVGDCHPDQKLKASGVARTNRTERYTTKAEAGAMSQTEGSFREPRHLGWMVDCKCKAEWAACVVLDPFCGAGTTGVMALRGGRSFIGIDGWQPYLEQARERIDREMPFFRRYEGERRNLPSDVVLAEVV